MIRPLENIPRAVVLCSVLLIALGVVDDAHSEEPKPTIQQHTAPLSSGNYLRVGERLAFHGYWLGIPVGYGWIEVKEIVALQGRRAIHIEAQGHTNEVLSQLYPIHDVVHSYLDAETLKPLRFEKHQREGHYRSDEIVTFDLEHLVATYHSLKNGAVKEIHLPQEFQDIISVLYWFRAQRTQAGQPVFIDLYTDEKIYNTEVLVSRPTILELRRRGSFSCLLVEPKAKFKGLLVKRGRIWAYLTADESRLPLFIQATTPWGPMSAVIDEESVPPALLYKHHTTNHLPGS